MIQAGRIAILLHISLLEDHVFLEIFSEVLS